MRSAPRRLQHIAGLLGCRSHAGLSQHMVALFQRRQGERAVHVWPGPDADGVDRIVFQQFLPVVINPGNVELLCHTMTRLAAAIDHPKELHPFDLAKARDVTVADVPTCPDKTDANFFLSHAKPPSRTSATASRAPSAALCDLVTRPKAGRADQCTKGGRSRERRCGESCSANRPRVWPAGDTSVVSQR